GSRDLGSVSSPEPASFAGIRTQEAGHPMREVLEYLAKNLVSDPDAVKVDEVTNGTTVSLRLSVAPDDMGKIIGRGGRTVRAIRDVLRAAAKRDGPVVTFDRVVWAQTVG